ncbi:hypothetical protein [Corynebacterium pacaense]|uniref:hypothetical protein n=1 Tax=Corynebacterium pacaense TaxID=1816684 RepID=UPI0009BB341D|nr:hypothetical protein [Corynebacterium pacaense]
MPRRNKRNNITSARDLPRDGSSYWGTRTQEGPGWAFGEPYMVRQMGSAAARKFYVCPGCNQNIPPGVAHIVAWPRERADDRRHWHSACWERR